MNELGYLNIRSHLEYSVCPCRNWVPTTPVCSRLK